MSAHSTAQDGTKRPSCRGPVTIEAAGALVAATCLLFSGCSVFIAQSGTDLQPLVTRHQVHEKLGEPATSGFEDGAAFDQYRTRRKFSDEMAAAGDGMGFAMTVGLGEFFAFPHELYLLAKRTIVGQDVRFEYDDSGVVTHASLDGAWPYLARPAWSPKTSGDDEAVEQKE